MSVQHAVAAALALGKAGLDQFTDDCARDPAVVEMRRRIEVVRDSAVATIAAQVELTTQDGTNAPPVHARPRAAAPPIR